MQYPIRHYIHKLTKCPKLILLLLNTISNNFNFTPLRRIVYLLTLNKPLDLIISNRLVISTLILHAFPLQFDLLPAFFNADGLLQLFVQVSLVLECHLRVRKEEDHVVPHFLDLLELPFCCTRAVVESVVFVEVVGYFGVRGGEGGGSEVH